MAPGPSPHSQSKQRLTAQVIEAPKQAPAPLSAALSSGKLPRVQISEEKGYLALKQN